MKRVISLVMSAVILLSLAACNGGNPSASSMGSSAGGNSSAAPTSSDSGTASVEFPKFMTIGGASTGGVFFGAASGIAQLLSTKTSTKATAQTTTGGGQNIQLMGKGEFEMAIADNLVSQQAYKGTDTFKGAPNTNIRAICAIYPAYFQQMVRGDSGISKMSDMKGKTMVVGGPGSGTEITTNQVYSAEGIDYVNRKDITPAFLGVDTGIDKVENQQADGITSISPPPFSSFVELAMSSKGKLVSLDDAAITKLTADGSPYRAGVIKAGTYQNQTEDCKTIYMSTLLIVNKDVPDDLVYAITKMIFENKDYLVTQNSCFNYLDVKTASQGLTIPLAAGAERYYKEQGVSQ